MSPTEILARIDASLRPVAKFLPSQYYSFIYSYGRKFFLNLLQNEKPEIFIPSDNLKRTFWGIEFQSSLFNAAGMFKGGDGYELCQRQGAGAYLAGTSTANSRYGNKKNGILHPFIPYPNSGSASNWMGLPNAGHAALAKRISEIDKKKGCPVGISVAADPEQNGMETPSSLIDGMKLFEKAKVDFIEMNESCPNVPHEQCNNFINGIDSALIERLEYISKNFIKLRNRNLPVIVKFSSDTNAEQLPYLLDLLINIGYDGANFGNTSTDYTNLQNLLDPRDIRNFKYFTEEFGGGLSGEIIKDKSLNLCKSSTKYLKEHPANHEFHIIRTGGISTANDLKQSDLNDISLNQWFTGYFENFAKKGHKIYKKMLE